MIRSKTILLAACSVVASALVACGARTALRGDENSSGGSVADGGSGGSTGTGPSECATPPAPSTQRCTGWSVGQDKLLAETPTNNYVEVDGFVTTSCGALAAWKSAEVLKNGATAWRTLAIGFDGATEGQVIEHPSLAAVTPTMGLDTNASLAANGARVALLELDATGSKFLELDHGGKELESALSLGNVLCADVAPVAGDWGFLCTDSLANSAPTILETLDPKTQTRTDVNLPLPAGSAVLDRLVFGDGSFLLETLSSDQTNGSLQVNLQWLDANGSALSVPAAVSGTTDPVTLVGTKSGALVANVDGQLALRPVGQDGASTGPLVVVDPNERPQFALAPAPNGDVMMAWSATEADGTLSTLVAALSSDGNFLGPPTTVASHLDPNNIVYLHGAVESTGGRALLLLTKSDGIHAVPLTCATGG